MTSYESSRRIAFIFRGCNLNQTYHTKSISPEIANAALFYGMYSEIARKLKVSPQHVRQVALGFSRSRRVENAILHEIKRRTSQIGEKAA